MIKSPAKIRITDPKVDKYGKTIYEKQTFLLTKAWLQQKQPRKSAVTLIKPKKDYQEGKKRIEEQGI